MAFFAALDYQTQESIGLEKKWQDWKYNEIY